MSLTAAERDELLGMPKAEFRRLLFEQQAGRCHYCDVPMTLLQVQPGGFQPRTLASIDHVVPQATGGTFDPANLVLACRICNDRKGSGPAPAPGEWHWQQNPQWYREGGPRPRRHAEAADMWTAEEDRALFLLSHPRVVAAFPSGLPVSLVLSGRTKTARRSRRRRMMAGGDWRWHKRTCGQNEVLAFIQRLQQAVVK